MKEQKFYLLTFLRGLCMGAADVVPGVSGGTIALILGIYKRFIHAITTLNATFLLFLMQYIFSCIKFKPDKTYLTKSKDKFLQIDLKFLIPLAIGIVIAFIIGSKIIPYAMINYPGPTFAFFSGLILISARIPFKMIEKVQKSHIVIMIIAFTLSYLFVGLQTDRIEIDERALLNRTQKYSEEKTLFYSGRIREVDVLSNFIEKTDNFRKNNNLESYNLLLVLRDSSIVPEKYNEKDWITFKEIEDRSARKELESQYNLKITERPATNIIIFLCGIIAISVMILPGVSGSFMLLFLGQYRTILETVSMTVGNLHNLIIALLSGNTTEFMIIFTESRYMFLFSFLFGLLIGMTLFSRVMSYLLENFQAFTMASLTGLMIGSLRKLLGEVIYSEFYNHTGLFIATIAMFLTGFFIVYFLEMIGDKK